MLIKRIFAVVLTSVLSCAVLAGSGNALIGWQTFETTTPGNNNTGIGDTTPDTNSTYDLSPTGNISASNYYLTGAIGAGASSLGRRGLGQARNSDFLNGNGFGAAPPGISPCALAYNAARMSSTSASALTPRSLPFSFAE